MGENPNQVAPADVDFADAGHAGAPPGLRTAGQSGPDQKDILAFLGHGGGLNPLENRQGEAVEVVHLDPIRFHDPLRCRVVLVDIGVIEPGVARLDWRRKPPATHPQMPWSYGKGVLNPPHCL